MKNSIDILNWRYATKKFDNTKIVSEDKIAILKHAFNLTATSYGLQPIKLVIIKNKKIQQSLVPYSFNQNQVAQASHLFIICIENTVSANNVEAYFDKVKKVRGTSEEILQPYKKMMLNSFENQEEDKTTEWSKQQAYIALGNLMTVCAFEEIDSCPMEGFVPAGYDELLGLNEKGLSSVLVLPVGYRADDDMFADFKKVRKDLTESIIEIN